VVFSIIEMPWVRRSSARVRRAVTAVGFELEALLHDAAEAFMGDITRPLKQMLPEYKKIENDVENAVLKRFGLTVPLSLRVKDADLRVLAAEQSQIMPRGTDDWAREH
jgi:5'-deoxynucleotidase YfbR-like HD superfamily hydrolase